MEKLNFNSDGTKISAKLYNNKTENTIVLLLTGDSPKGLMSVTWQPIIDLLVENDFCVFAFDFYSQGESEGLRDNLTLTRGIANFKDALTELSGNYLKKGRKVCAIASSFGGAVVLNSEFFLEVADAIILKSPASILFECYENEHGGIEGLKKWEQEKVSQISGLSYQAYLDSLGYNCYSKLRNIKYPVIIIHGDSDETVPIVQSKRLAHIIGEYSELHILKGVHHNYKQENAMSTLNNIIIRSLNKIFK